MRLLLINKNPVVSRMMQMSVPKAGFEIEECDSVYDLPSGSYEVVVLDDEMYDENFLHDIRQNIKYYQLGIITSSKEADLANFDFVLTKPFLPTDLIEILRKVKSDIESQKELIPMQEHKEEQEDLFESFLEGKEVEEEAPLHEEARAKLFETEEPIVKVEEEPQESPFIEEPLERAGVLQEEEINKVSALLNEPEPMGKEEVVKELDELLEDRELVSIAPVEESQEKIEEPQAFEEEPVKESAPELTPEAMLTAMQENPQEASLNDLKHELQKLDVKGLREILDGMQLEITIKISYPDRTDV